MCLPKSIASSKFGMLRLLFVAVQQLELLRAGEQVAGHAGARAGPGADRGAGPVGLVAVEPVLAVPAHPRRDLLLLVGHQRGQPVLVGEADPAALGLGLEHLVVVERLVFLLDQAAVEIADQALMDVQVLGRRRAPARDDAVGIERHRPVGGVVDRVGDREHVVRVDGIDALEAQPGTIVPGERHRLVGRQRVAARRPDRVAVGRHGRGARSATQPNSA